MSKLFWLGLGAAAGVLAVRKATKTLQAYTPHGVVGSLGELGEAVREFAAAVREGMDAREGELRIALGVDAGTLDAETARQILENPTSPRD